MRISRRIGAIVLVSITALAAMGAPVSPVHAEVGPQEPGATRPLDPGRYQPPTGPIHWSLRDAEVVEGNPGDTTYLSFELVASHAPLQNLAFWASALSVTATAGEDFVGFEDELVVFPAGATSMMIHVEVIGDVFVEDDEIVRLNVWRPSRDGFSPVLLAYGIIIDDDDIWGSVPPIEIPKAQHFG